jgi:ethanolamine utilization protein EutQ (cupin superfamily)
MKIKELKINTVIRTSKKMKVGITVESFLITSLEFRKNSKNEEFVYVGFIPCSEKDSVQCGFGYTRIFDTSEEWGIQSFEFVKNEKQIQHQNYPNLVGNPGYDLIHDPAPRFRKDY